MNNSISPLVRARQAHAEQTILEPGTLRGLLAGVEIADEDGRVIRAADPSAAAPHAIGYHRRKIAHSLRKLLATTHPAWRAIRARRHAKLVAESARVIRQWREGGAR